ncbi:MAG: helix-turn-helix domain-containing protein [Clostridiales Family XIII bacterium]|nr:helix-turn-helix domain-containing protein [Clostridiales Family XIII bacterium]
MAIYNLKTRYKKVLGEESTKLLSIGNVQWRDNRFNRVIHKHDDQIEFLLITNGSGTQLIDGVFYKVSAGDIIVHDAGSMHEEGMSDEKGMDVLYIAAHVDLGNANGNINRLVPDGVSPIIRREQHFHTIFCMCQSMYKKIDQVLSQMPDDAIAYAHALELNNYMLKAIIMIVMDIYAESEPRLTPAEDVLGARIRQYLDAHYLEDVSLQDIADSLNINRYYLSHVFKKMTGVSPMAYIIRHRIGDAQRLLNETEDQVSDIAYQVGFNSLNHFNNMFVRLTGMTASKFRRFRREDM